MVPKNKIGIFIPVRLESKRLRSKHIIEFLNTSPLEILVKNLSTIKGIKKKNIIICSPKNNLNKKLKNYCKKINCSFFQGSENNLIKRFYECNQKFKFNLIAEVDGDDILTDPNVLNNCIRLINNSSTDFIYTKGLPVGLNCKVFTSNALNYVNSIVGSKNNEDGFMYYFYKSQKLKKKILNYKKVIKNSRFTLDYSSDLEFIKYIYSYSKLYKLKYNLKNYKFLLNKFPFIRKININNNKLWINKNKKMKKLTITENNITKKFSVA